MLKRNRFLEDSYNKLQKISLNNERRNVCGIFRRIHRRIRLIPGVAFGSIPKECLERMPGKKLEDVLGGI